MQTIAKASAAALIALATLASAVPAGAQDWNRGSYGDYGGHGDYRSHDGRHYDWRDERRWDDRHRARQHCWTEKRWDPYRHQRVKVRMCDSY